MEETDTMTLGTKAGTTPSQTIPTCPVLGVPVAEVTIDEAMALLDAFIQSGDPHIVVTADSSGLVQAQDDPELKQIYLNADLATPDSNGVTWAMRRKSGKAQDRVSGVELADRLCALSAQKGYKIFFLGAEPGVAELAAEKVQLKHPGCQIVGTRHGYFPAEDDEIVAREIAPLNPDILLVALGIPRQEKLIAKTQSIIGARVAMGVGGTLDVFSGRVKRAPVLFQKLKLEWLWRLVLNPKKIDKVGLLPKFVRMVLREKA